MHGLIEQEANSLNCSSSSVHPASFEAENCYVDVDCTGEVGGNEELPRMGFSDQKDKALLSIFKNGKIAGEYSLTSDLGSFGRISAPDDELYKKLKEMFDSVHAYIRCQVAAGNYQALNHEFKNGKGTRADYLRFLVHRHPKFQRVKARTTLPMAESSKMVSSYYLYEFSNACLTYHEIFKIGGAKQVAN